MFIEFPHVMHAYSSFGLTTPVYAHFDNFGLGACIPLRLLFSMTISFLQAVVLSSMWGFLLLFNVSTDDLELQPMDADRSYKAAETLSSDAQIDQRNVTFSAGQSVVLGVGFEVGTQSILSIEINDSCSMD